MAPTHIATATRVEAAGTPPKLIDEYIGRVRSGSEAVSIAHMHGYAVLPGLPVVVAVSWTVRARQKIAISRHSLTLIEKQQAQLPKATLRAG